MAKVYRRGGRMKIGKNDSLPLYIQLKNIISHNINNGIWNPGDVLPAETELCQKYDISQITVRRALKDLAKEGCLVRIKGKGTFVAFEKNNKQVKQKRIALIVPDIEDLFIAQIYKGIEDVARQRGYQIATYSSARSIEGESSNLNLLMGGSEIGAILFTYWGQFNAGHILKLKKNGYPFVLIDRYFPEIETDTVTVDNINGAYSAAKHLVDLGHRRIGFIAGVPCTANLDRAEGYRRALGDAGIPYNPDLVQHISTVDTAGSIRFEPDDTGGYNAMHAILKINPRPTAIFACNDYIALGAIKAIKEEGLRIPGDISIVGFDDLKFCSTLDVPLTTVRQPKREIGENAAQILIDKIERSSSHIQKIVLPTKLIVRESAGAEKTNI